MYFNNYLLKMSILFLPPHTSGVRYGFCAPHCYQPRQAAGLPLALRPNTPTIQQINIATDPAGRWPARVLRLEGRMPAVQAGVVRAGPHAGGVSGLVACPRGDVIPVRQRRAWVGSVWRGVKIHAQASGLRGIHPD